MTLTATSTLDFGSGGVGTLVFAGFTPAGNTLNIVNYLNTTTDGITTSGVDGTDDRIVFATDQSGNLSAFNFGAGTTAVQIAMGDGYSNNADITAVPEASTWVAGTLAFATILYAQRRRFLEPVVIRA